MDVYFNMLVIEVGNAIPFRLEAKAGGENCCYNRSRRVCVNTSYKYDPTIILSHELGHLIDLSPRPDLEIIHELTGTRRIQTELRAWAIASELLYAIGFEDWDAFYQAMVDCMESYYANPRYQ